MAKVFASWSGGKESSFACYKAISDGLEVSYLLNMITEDAKRSMSHGLDSGLIYAQSQAVEIPMVQKRTTWGTYEQDFKDVVSELKREGIEGGVFGDIDIQEHKDWVERVCKELNIKPYLPLWGANPDTLLSDFMGEGFEAIVVSAKATYFDKEWLGRKINKGFIEDLAEVKSRFDIHLCGESGEYHTFVTSGPIFKKQIKLLDSEKVWKNGYWFLDVSRYEVVG